MSGHYINDPVIPSNPLRINADGSINVLIGPGAGSTTSAVTGASSTNGGTATTVIAAPATGSIHVTSLQFGNSSATGVTVAINDASTSTFVVPANGGNNPQITVPLTVAATTALTFTSSSPQTTIYCNAQGYVA